MASHPAISGPGTITQMIGFLKKNFPATITTETIKKYGLASNSESSVVHALHFIGLIDGTGKRQENAHEVLKTEDEEEFKAKFAGLINVAYSELFKMYGDEAWTLPKPKLVGYFRQADGTGEVIGARQAAVFQAFGSLAGYGLIAEPIGSSELEGKKPRPGANKAPKAKIEDVPPDIATPEHQGIQVPSKPDMALTIRIEINLPPQGTQDTYDAIFKSIKAHLYP